MDGRGKHGFSTVSGGAAASGSSGRRCRGLALADMIADTERLGLYDADPEDVKAALKAARKKSEG